jgi:hypothetical protein
MSPAGMLRGGRTGRYFLTAGPFLTPFYVVTCVSLDVQGVPWVDGICSML